MSIRELACTVSVLIASAASAAAQNADTLQVLQGLAPVSALGGSSVGKAALAANLVITGHIQDGSARQPILLPFSEQQQQALRDAFITGGNASELADGLGSKLGSAYHASVTYTSKDDGKTSSFTNVSPAIAQLIAYAMATTSADSAAGKYFFANATLDKKQPLSPAALEIFKEIGGTTDVFGKAYGFPGGNKGAGRYGNARPFQTEPHLAPIEGKDYFGVASGNLAYLHGPTQDLRDSPSFPSGHTTYAYTEALVLALLVPQRYPQMIVRAADYGNDRIILGAHYTMDVLGGRTLALYDIAQLLADKPGYVGTKKGGVQIDDFQKAVVTARVDLTKNLEAGCSKTIAACAREDHGRFAHPLRNRAFYEATQTYGLPVVFEQNAKRRENVAKLAPEAGYLLTTAFPYLTLTQADALLTATEGPGGGFLDNGSSFGVYSRIDLYKAAQKAIAMAP